MARFWIEHTFTITGRGFVLAGQIVDGTISSGMEVYLPREANEDLPVKISSVDFADNISDRKSWVCLVLPRIHEEEHEHLRSLQLEGKTVEVIDAPPENPSKV